MQYTIEGNQLTVVICNLNAGEQMITERGSMSWMSPNMKMETTSNGGLGKAFGRMFSGESIFMNTYTAEQDGAKVAFATTVPGDIIGLDLAKHKEGFVFQKGAFLCA